MLKIPIYIHITCFIEKTWIRSYLHQSPCYMEIMVLKNLLNLKVVNKKVFVVSDIHNDADRFKLLLEKIDFAEDDILILAGDIFDRGNQSIELYFEILKHPNIQVIQGNHDVWLAREIMEKSIDY